MLSGVHTPKKHHGSTPEYYTANSIFSLSLVSTFNDPSFITSKLIFLITGELKPKCYDYHKEALITTVGGDLVNGRYPYTHLSCLRAVAYEVGLPCDQQSWNAATALGLRNELTQHSVIRLTVKVISCYTYKLKNATRILAVLTQALNKSVISPGFLNKLC